MLMKFISGGETRVKLNEIVVFDDLNLSLLHKKAHFWND